MSKKYDAIKRAVFYANQKPQVLAEILEGLVSDTLTSIAISGADSINIPSGNTANTATYTAQALSQFGDAMDNAVTIALKASVTGVSISSGVVSVAKTATATSFTITATSGTVVAEKTVALVSA